MAPRSAIDAARDGYRKWSEKPHNARWARKIDGTPIPNDLPVCIANEFMSLVTEQVASIAFKDAELARHRSDLSTALARNAEIEGETIERAAVAGWNACRKSVYAVCEDVDREAEETYLKASKGGSPTSTEGHLSEFQSGHVSGYRSGMVRAAKSIARGFNSMEAMDDDNLIAAIRSSATKQEKAE